MENPTPAPLLQIDLQSRTYLFEIIRWSRLLAVVGFILCGLIVLTGLYFVVLITFQSGFPGNEGGSGATLSSAGILAGYAFLALLLFYPCLFLYRFTQKTKLALQANDQEVLTEGFANLKATFRYVGVFTLLMVVFYLLAIVFFVCTVAFSHPPQ